MSLNLKLNNIINFFKTSYKNKNVLVKYKKNQLLLRILEKFLEENVIHGFYEENGYYYIYLKYNSVGEPVIKDLKMFYKRPFELSFNVKQLKNKQFIKKYIDRLGKKSSFYIFSTNKGLCTYNECLNKNAGGILLFAVKCT